MERRKGRGEGRKMGGDGRGRKEDTGLPNASVPLSLGVVSENKAFR